MAEITVQNTVGNMAGNQTVADGFLADNGNVWKVVPDFTGDVRWFYSSNKGSTWNDTGYSFGTSFPSGVVCYNIGNRVWWATESLNSPNDFYGIIVWCSLNAGRTGITTDSWTYFWGPGSSDYVVVHQMQAHVEGSGYKVHMVTSNRWYDDNRYWRFSANSAGAITGTDVNENWWQGGAEGVAKGACLLDPATKDIHLVAFNNEGLPNMSVVYSKRAYTSATWPAGTNRTIFDGSSYNSNSLTAAFDGDRTVIAFSELGNTSTPRVFERDKADTATTDRTPPTGISSGSSSTVAVTTNAQKDILLVYNDVAGDTTDIYKNTYTRATNTWSGATLVIDSPSGAVANSKFIPGTKYYFFDDVGVFDTRFLTDMLEVAYSGAALETGVAVMSATPSFTLQGGTVIPRPIIEVAFDTDPTNEFPAWEDVSEYVSSFNVRRGRQAELDIIEPGSASFVFDNEDRRFDPSNTASPYYPNVLPVRRIRVRAIWNNVIYDVFSGYVHGWPQEYPDKARNQVSVQATDAMGFLQFTELHENRGEEASGTRISAILSDAAWPANQRNLDVGEETLAEIIDSQGSALQLAQAAARAELGRLFAAKNGDITFHGRNRSMQDLPVSSGTWSDDDSGADFDYEDIVPSFDEEKIYNRVNITRTGGVEQTTEDATSKTKYFVRDFSESDLPLVYDATALSRAQFLLSQYKDPKLRFTSMIVNPRVDSSFAASLSLELGDHVVAERFTSSMITQDVIVDGIALDANRNTKTWEYTFYLTPVPTIDDYWIAGVGILNTSTKLAF